MPKFTCEIDSEEKTTKFMIDGQEVELAEFSVGCYNRYNSCCEPDKDMEIDGKQCYVSITTGDKENSYSHSIHFSTGSDPSYSESRTITRVSSVAKEVGKVIQRAIASAKLGQALLKYSGKK